MKKSPQSQSKAARVSTPRGSPPSVNTGSAMCSPEQNLELVPSSAGSTPMRRSKSPRPGQLKRKTRRQNSTLPRSSPRMSPKPSPDAPKGSQSMESLRLSQSTSMSLNGHGGDGARISGSPAKSGNNSPIISVLPKAPSGLIGGGAAAAMPRKSALSVSRKRRSKQRLQRNVTFADDQNKPLTEVHIIESRRRRRPPKQNACCVLM